MDEYKTSDLGIAAYLLSQGLVIKDVEVLTNQQFVFVFNIDSQDGMRVEDDWWAGKLKVDPRYYSASNKQMKELIYHTKKRLSDAKRNNLVIY